MVNTFIGGSIFVVPGANGQGNPVNGRVLLGQVTTSGTTNAQINIQFRDAAQESLYATGMTLTFPVAGAGCNDPLACNYDENAEGDGDCIFPAEFYDCDGCVNDTDGDGVCDELEVPVAPTILPTTLTSTPRRRTAVANNSMRVVSAVETTAHARAAPTHLLTTTTQQHWLTTVLASSVAAPTRPPTTTTTRPTTTMALASSAVAPTLMQITMIPRPTTTMALASSAVAPILMQTTSTPTPTMTMALASSAVAPTLARRITTLKRTTTTGLALQLVAPIPVQTITTQ